MQALSVALLAACILAGRAGAHDGPIAQTPPDERDLWISLGTRVHRGFGTLIALGIRIGEDARQQLQSAKRELDVTYYSGVEAPCPCVADGVMIATRTSPGQRSLRVSDTPAAPGQFGRVVIVHKPTRRTLEYVIPQPAAAPILAANGGTPVERWNAVMSLPQDRVFTRRDITDIASRER